MNLPDRATLRRRLIEAREALDDKTRRMLTEAIERHLWRLLEGINPVSLGFCWPYRAEPDLTGMVASWLRKDASRNAALPVVVDKDLPLLFRDWQPATPLERDCHGIPTPASGEFRRPEVVLVPVNGFDARGYRIGYGGGYFDRTLAALQPPPPHDRRGLRIGAAGEYRPAAT